MIWGIVSLVLLVVIIGLTIWLLVRSNYTCPTGAKLNESCTTSSDCNSGLVCETVSGVNGATGATGLGRVCKVALGGVCSLSSECGPHQTCVNGICRVNLGTLGQACPCDTGFTCINGVCRAVLGQACSAGPDCETGLCVNNICVAPQMGPTGCYTDCDTVGCFTDTRHSDTYCTDYTDRHHSDSYGPNSYSPNTHHSDSYGSKSYGSKSYGSKTHHKSSESDREWPHDSWSSHHGKKKHCKSESYSWSNSSDCTDSCQTGRYRKHGVYVTNQQNNDRTLFTGIPEAITDIAEQGSGNFYLLLANGNIVNSVGINNVTLTTNKKMFRMVRFGSDYVGVDYHGCLYSRSGMTGGNWTWSRLQNFPDRVIFIDTTNDYQNLEVLTDSGKAYLYKYSTDWRNGKCSSTRKQRDYRYYGQSLTRWIDIDQRDNSGKTNTGERYRGIKAAGFYNPLLGSSDGGELIQVLTEDSFTHVRVIANNAYFLFQQC